MSDILSERSGSVLRIQLNRPASKNAMTSAMYITLGEMFNNAAKDDQIRVNQILLSQLTEQLRALPAPARPETEQQKQAPVDPVPVATRPWWKFWD